MTNFTGRWLTTFGPMELTQEGPQVQGTYGPSGIECTLAGTVDQSRLTFQYQEPTVGGEGWFDLIRHGKFAGQWREEGSETWFHWIGDSSRSDSSSSGRMSERSPRTRSSSSGCWRSSSSALDIMCAVVAFPAASSRNLPVQPSPVSFSGLSTASPVG